MVRRIRRQRHLLLSFTADESEVGFSWRLARVYVNDTIGQEAGLGDGGREQVVARDTPQDLALRAGSDPRGEQRSRRTINRAIAATSHLVRRAKRQSAFRQMLVNHANAERQHGPMTRGSPFEMLNALGCLRIGRVGDARMSLCSSSEIVSSLFVLSELKSQLSDSVTQRDEG